MGQSLTSLLVHVVFSTKHRRNIISPDIEPELFAYISQVSKSHNSPCLAINGTANHVHLLIVLSKNLALSNLVRDLKRNSSRWIKTKGPKFNDFEWQDGYGAFTIGQSGVDTVKRYISRQKIHHHQSAFEVELKELLTRYQIEFDENHLWE
ncbi:MAG: IS200/IS605 family transposase [Acidobacteria bacterium]|nr:IS200/IS605 family transposase [Acidobacteriota bacterium]